MLAENPVRLDAFLFDGARRQNASHAVAANLLWKLVVLVDLKEIKFNILRNLFEVQKTLIPEQNMILSA